MGVYGYARVSTREQNVNRQLDALRKFPVEGANIIVDMCSGATFERPGYVELMSRLLPGDVFVVTSIDRLGRNYDEIIEQWRVITREKMADIVVLDMPLLDTRSSSLPTGITGVFLADLMLQLLSYVAQIEREHIRQRQAEGITAARARGVKLGRPEKRRPACYGEIVRRVDAGEMTKTKAAKCLGVSRTTLYKWRLEDVRP